MSATAPLLKAVRAAEVALAELVRARQASPALEPREALARLDQALRAIEQAENDLAARAATAPSNALGARLASVRARAALQDRAAPEAAFDGLYEAVRSGVVADHWGRAGMSRAFLDAPGTLARWRFVASAACLLLLVGGGVLLQGGLAWDARDTSQPLRDPRDDLLRRRAEAAEATASSDVAPGRGAPAEARLLRPVGYASPGGPPASDGLPASDGARPPARGYISFHFRWGSPGGVRSRRTEARALDAAGRQLRVLFPSRGRDARTGPESN